MTLGESLYGYLTGYGALGALVGTRIYPMRLPQKPTLPGIVYHQISRRPEHVRTGIVKPIVAVRMQFDVVAERYSQVESVAAALKTALYSYVSSDPVVYSTMVEGEREQPLTEPTLQQFGRSIDATIWYAEEEG